MEHVDNLLILTPLPGSGQFSLANTMKLYLELYQYSLNVNDGMEGCRIGAISGEHR